MDSLLWFIVGTIVLALFIHLYNRVMGAARRRDQERDK